MSGEQLNMEEASHVTMKQPQDDTIADTHDTQHHQLPLHHALDANGHSQQEMPHISPEPEVPQILTEPEVPHISGQAEMPQMSVASDVPHISPVKVSVIQSLMSKETSVIAHKTALFGQEVDRNLAETNVNMFESSLDQVKSDVNDTMPLQNSESIQSEQIKINEKYDQLIPTNSVIKSEPSAAGMETLQGTPDINMMQEEAKPIPAFTDSQFQMAPPPPADLGMTLDSQVTEGNSEMKVGVTDHIVEAATVNIEAEQADIICEGSTKALKDPSLKPKGGEALDVKLEAEYDEMFQNPPVAPTMKEEVNYDKAAKQALKASTKLGYVTNGRNGEFPCIECDYVARRKDKLTLHFKIHHLGFKHKCDRCNKEFARTDKLKKHKREDHGEETVYSCNTCSYSSAIYKDYLNHIKEHPTKMFKCDYCSYFSPRQHRLKDHVERKHEHGAYPCELCGFIAISSRTLTRHKESKHSDMDYPCDMCDYKGKRPDHLAAHQNRVHKLNTNTHAVREKFGTVIEGRAEPKQAAKQLEKMRDKTDDGGNNSFFNTNIKSEMKEEFNLKKENIDFDDFGGMYGQDDAVFDAGGVYGQDIDEETFAEINPFEWLIQQGALSYEVKREYDDDTLKSEIKPDPMDFIQTSMYKNDDYNESMDEDDDDDYNPKRKHDDSLSPYKTKKIKVEAGVKVKKEKRPYAKKTHKSKDEGPFNCSYEGCDYQSPRKDKVKSHIKNKHEGGGNDIFTCTWEGCDYTSPRKDRLNLHVRIKHEGASNYVCQVEGCDYNNPRKDKVNEHTRIKHLGIRFPCELCGYQATRRDKLKIHMEVKHYNPQPRKKRIPKYEDGQIHYCDKCDYKSDKMKNLQSHSERVHSELTFQCDQCEFTTTFKLNLKLHTDRMHGNKILMCDKCSYTTKDPIRLKYHNESKHDPNKHPCDMCDYVGNMRCELMRHLRRKHRHETYKCDQCDYVGKRIDHLRDHKRRIHEGHLPGMKTPKKRRTKQEKNLLPPPGPMIPQAAINHDLYTSVGQSVIRPPPLAHTAHLTGHGGLNHATLQLVHDHDEKPTPRELSVYASQIQNLANY